MNIKKKMGFTLPEVCVSISVFVFGILALGYYVQYLVLLFEKEHTYIKSSVDLVNEVELFIENPPKCMDTLNPLLVKNNLMYLVKSNDYIQIKRVIKCKKN